MTNNIPSTHVIIPQLVASDTWALNTRVVFREFLKKLNKPLNIGLADRKYFLRLRVLRICALLFLFLTANFAVADLDRLSWEARRASRSTNSVPPLSQIDYGFAATVRTAVGSGLFVLSLAFAWFKFQFFIKGAWLAAYHSQKLSVGVHRGKINLTGITIPNSFILFGETTLTALLPFFQFCLIFSHPTILFITGLGLAIACNLYAAAKMFRTFPFYSPRLKSRLNTLKWMGPAFATRAVWFYAISLMLLMFFSTLFLFLGIGRIFDLPPWISLASTILSLYKLFRIYITKAVDPAIKYIEKDL